MDLDTGNAVLEVCSPLLTNKLLYKISPDATNAPIITRTLAMASTAWYNAVAPYSPTAAGAGLPVVRQPASERTDRNRNIAILYATLRLLQSFPPDDASLSEALSKVGSDPNDTQA